MAVTARCSKCGAPVSGEVAAGFCTACLLEGALAPVDLKESTIALKYFGDYELIEEIARGGMGVVFKARQRSLNRIVAVKMILSGHLASEAEAQRFRAEARAAAALQHSGIVAIHEVGEHEGLLFFSMDYVEGQNLAQLVRDGPLSATRAAQCVRDIAEAIHYAHERGVLHRDLKPSNVLLDSNGRPHVTDFGLAKRLTASEIEPQNPELTLSGQVLGSPNFMPPEQAAGRHRELTPASDVYSLGALLYHLLTGRPPFLADSIPATLRLVSETEPVAPRLLAPAVPRDLETICLKCLEKDPQRRYGTADELAAELQRFLNHEPIQARRIGAAGKVWRWSRRNPGLARTATAALVLFLAVIIGAPIALVQIDDARKQAEARQKEATLEAARSQQFAQVLKETLRSAGPSVARGRDTTLLRELLAKTSSRLETELIDQPDVQGDMYMTLGSTYRDMGDYQHAISMLENAVAKYRRAFHGDHKKLALALGYLGQYQSFNTDVAAGKESARAGLEMAQRCGDPETLAYCLMNVARSFEGWGMTATQGLAYAREAADLLRKLTNNPTALADCYGFMAGATLDGDRAEAERLARQALELNSKNLESDHPNVVSDIFMLGQIQLDRGKFAEAEVNLRETLRIHRKIYDSNHPHRFIIVRLLGDALTKQGKQAEVEQVYREALEIDGDSPNAFEAADKLASIWRAQGKRAEADRLVQDYTARWMKRRSTNDLLFAELLNTFANRAAEEKRFDEGAKLSGEALEIQLKLASNNLPKLITTLGGLAAMLDNAGKYSEAEPVLQRRLELQRRLYGNDASQIGDSLSWLAWVYYKDKKLSEEESLLQQRLAIQTKHFGARHTNLLDTLDRLASNFEGQHRLKEALAFRQEWLAISQKEFGENDARSFSAETKLIVLLLKQSSTAEGEALEKKLAARVEKMIKASEASTNLPSTIDDLGKFCYALEHSGRNALAESLLVRRLELQRKLYGEDGKPVLDSLGWMVEIQSQLGKIAEAAQILQQKIELESKQVGRADTNLLTNISWLADIYEQDGKWEQSEPLRQEVLEARKKLFGDEHPKTISAARKLARLLLKEKRFGEAEVIGRDIVGRAPHQPENWAVLIDSLTRQAKTNHATEVLREPLAKYREVQTNQLALAQTLISVATQFSEQENWAQAEPLAREAFTTQTTLGVVHPSAFQPLAVALAHLNRISELNNMVRDQIVALKNSKANDSLATASFLKPVGWDLDKAKAWDAAALCVGEAFAIEEKKLSNDLGTVTGTLTGLSAILDRGGRFSEAEPLMQRRVEMLRELHGKDDSRVAEALSWLAIVYEKDKKFVESEVCARDGLAIQHTLGTNNPSCLIRLVRALRRQKKNSDADGVLEEHLSLLRQNYKNDPIGLVQAVKSIADTFVNTYEAPAEEKMLEQALAIQRNTLTNGSPEIVATLDRLCYALEKQKKTNEAALLKKQLADLRATSPATTSGK